MTHDKIRIEKIRAFGYHGVLPEENLRGQNFFITLELELDLRAAGTHDDLTQTVNYAEIIAHVVELVEAKPPVKLIETLAEKIAATLLESFPRICRINVEVHKPEAPIPTPFADLCVAISRERASA